MKIPSDYIKTVEGYKQFRDKVEEVIDWIEFDKIASVMEFLDWKWSGLENKDTGTFECRVPTKDEIIKQTRRLLIECVETAKSDIWNINTGGINVKAVVYDPSEEGIDDDLKKELELTPDDFEHRVDLLFRFSIEESLPMY